MKITVVAPPESESTWYEVFSRFSVEMDPFFFSRRRRGGGVEVEEKSCSPHVNFECADVIHVSTLPCLIKIPFFCQLQADFGFRQAFLRNLGSSRSWLRLMLRVFLPQSTKSSAILILDMFFQAKFSWFMHFCLTDGRQAWDIGRVPSSSPGRVECQLCSLLDSVLVKLLCIVHRVRHVPSTATERLHPPLPDVLQQEQVGFGAPVQYGATVCSGRRR